MHFNGIYFEDETPQFHFDCIDNIAYLNIAIKN